MIDKIEVRVPRATPFSPEFGPLYCDGSVYARVFRPSQHYLAVGDLRGLGFQSILHTHCLRNKRGDHKLELVDTGDLSYVQMQLEISRIFDTDPRRTILTRIDVAADVPGVPVSWFVRNARAKWKKWANEIGKVKELEYSKMGRRQVETFYLGKRPNVFRIYDKIGEWRYQYNKIAKGLPEAAEPPDFEKKYGYPLEGLILTRVERQMGGGRIPKQIDQVGKLSRLLEVDPFDRIELLGGNGFEPDINRYEVMEYCAGIGIRKIADDIGVHKLRSLLNFRSKGNANRILEKYASFLLAEKGIDSVELLKHFRASLGRQMAG